MLASDTFDCGVLCAAGGSLREASYGFSISDPVYHVDPKPAAPQVLGAKKHAKASSEPHTLQPVAPAPSSNKVRIGVTCHVTMLARDKRAGCMRA